MKFHLHDNIKTGVYVCSSIFKYAVGTHINNAHTKKNQDHEEQLQHNFFVPSDTEKYTLSKTDLLSNVKNCQKGFQTCTYTKD